MTAQKLVVRGGVRLKGEVQVSGGKNAALPLLAATLLASGRSQLRNLPQVGDVATMSALLRHLGGDVSGSRVTVVDTSAADGREAPYPLVRAMRASVLVLGPLLARHGEARVPLPGGCVIGPRPIDEHCRGLTALGAEIALEGGVIVAHVPGQRLRGASHRFAVTTVTGTETLMMAAALARGRTTLENAAREPEIEELARVLNKMGARISGAGTATIAIDGVSALHPVEHTVLPDRIEAGTLMLAAAVTRGDVLVRGCETSLVEAVSEKLRDAGVEITDGSDGVRVRARQTLRPTDVTTRPHPGFPTDLAPLFTVVMALAKGQSVLTESVFERRFHHVPELQRMGADIVVDGRTAVVHGTARLSGAPVVATDVRAAAALLLAGLAAEGTTEVSQATALDRGYEGLDKKLRALGADLRRAPAPEMIA